MKLLEILQVLSACVVMILVTLQEGKDDGNIITGDANKGGAMGSSSKSRLATLTKYAGIIFAILTIVTTSLMIINY